MVLPLLFGQAQRRRSPADQTLARSAASRCPVEEALREARPELPSPSTTSVIALGLRLPKDLGIDRFESRKHFFRFGQSFQGNTVANGEEFVPHLEHVWVSVRSVDRGLRFPF